MIVSYQPADGPLEEVSTDDLSAKESADIETVTDLTWDEVERSLKSQAPTAMRAVLWAFHKRTAPVLRFSEFDVPGWKRRLKARLGREDVLDLVEGLRGGADPAVDFEVMVGYFRTMAHDPADVDWALAETTPKDPASPAVPAPARKAASAA